MTNYIFPKNRQFSKKKMCIKSSCLGVLFVCLAVHSGCFGQESFKRKENLKIDSILTSFKNSKEHQYLNLLPQVSYDALNNSFNVGFSLSGLANYYQQRKRNKIELAQLELSLNERLSNDLDKLNLEIENFNIDYEILKNQIDLFKLDFDLFQISKGKYQNNEITSEDFLKLKKSFLTQKNSLKTNVLRLGLKAKSIELKTKSDTYSVSLIILTKTINNYD